MYGYPINRFYVSSSLSGFRDVTTLLLHKEHDEIEGITKYEDDLYWLKYKYQTGIQLYFNRLKNGYIFPRLKLIYRADNWLFIDSFLIVADDQRFEKAAANFKRDAGSGSIWEWYGEHVSSEDLTMIKAIIKSKKATIRFKGKNYYTDYEITKNEKDRLSIVLEAIEEFSGATVLD